MLVALGAGFTYEMGVNRNLSTNAFFSHKAQGMPWVVVLLVILFAVWNFVLSRTRYGRHVYAVGGNEEASRRAGVVVSRIRISVFVICSGMAAVSGMIAASLLQSVQSNAGAGNTLLLAVGRQSSAARRCSAGTAASSTPFSAAWSSRSSSTA
ncbi:MAG TPA: hypothetical protein VGR06_06370 [Actinophytocola sp.]|uniref:ABC transporter permease subunit n=1 Tax=Actinophytocola sp. TaxID=1872138 RepID=UPI002E0620F9|nr:hypothetical protein [Actinophytocola sp.]